MTTRSLLGLAAVVSVLASGCPSTSGGNVRAPADLAPALGAVCDFIGRCPDFHPIASRSRDECIDIVYWALTCRLEGSTGVSRHELELDAASARACADFLSGLSCEDFRCISDGTCPEGAACAGLATGWSDGGGSDGDVVGPGEHCYRYGSPGCDESHFCAPEAYDEEHGVMLCEVCVPRLAAGETCDWYSPEIECGPGLVCVRSTDGTATCQTARGEGETCSGTSECAGGLFCGGTCLSGGHDGDPCSEDSECRWEENVTCVAGTCGARLPHGAPCTDDSDCAALRCHTDGLCGIPLGASCPDHGYCRSGYCPDRRVCQAPLSNGSACTEDAACASVHCDHASGTCTARPPPQPSGGPCEGASDCEEGLQCDSTCYLPCDDACPAGLVCTYTGRRTECIPPQPEGSSCEDDEGCLSGFCNDDEVCAIRPGIGDACTGFGDCYPRGYCSGGLCAARHGPGEACEGYDSCLEPFFCQNGHCTLISLACEPAPAGQACTFLRFCTPDAVCDLSSFTCVPRQPLGASCSSGFFENCAPGLYCASGPEGSACAARVAEGAACSAASVCAEGTYCIGGSCVASAGGQECHGSDGCPLETFCNDRTDTCEPYRVVGDACDPGDVECDPAFYCDRTTGLCAERPGLGEACDEGSWCAAGTTCSDDFGGDCVARAGLGDPCETSFYDPWGSNCEESLYCDQDVSPYACAPRRALGESCSSSAECVTNVCSDGRCLVTAECVLPSTP